MWAPSPVPASMRTFSSVGVQCIVFLSECYFGFCHYSNKGKVVLPNEKKKKRSSPHGAVEMNPTGNHEVAGLIPGLVQ